MALSVFVYTSRYFSPYPALFCSVFPTFSFHSTEVGLQTQAEGPGSGVRMATKETAKSARKKHVTRLYFFYNDELRINFDFH